MADKKILLISHNYAPEPTGIGKINGEMMDWLARGGYNCSVITTYPYYPQWKVQAPYRNIGYRTEKISYNGGSNYLTIYRCPSYIPVNPTGKKRVIQDFSYWFTMIWPIFKLFITREKFDLIITVAPPFHLAKLGLMIKKRLGSELLYHIQDLQIEASQTLNIVWNEKLLKRIFKIEKNILLNADHISGVSEGLIAKVKSKTNKDVYLFPNWVDTTYFYPISTYANLKFKWGYSSSDLIFLYSGSLGEKHGVEMILSAAELLHNTNPNVKFLICGSGPYINKLIQIARQKELTNVKFLPLQEKELFNEFLNMADYHLVLLKGNVRDLGMPSKLSTILAVGGVSIATSFPGTSLYEVITSHNLGYIIEPDDHTILTRLIQRLETEPVCEIKRKNARDYAIKNLNIDNVMDGMLSDVFKKEIYTSEEVQDPAFLEVG